ncbi:hypothetical protein RUND412_005105 [Rhizina undulata]
MAQNKINFKVIIAGGSVTGLTLAHTLDKAGIDFVVLEGREEIAPQGGASIAMFPNGARILDQLGIWNDLFRVIEPINRGSLRASDGKPFLRLGVGRMLEACFGYTFTFMDRQTLLQALYRNIKDKSKVLPDHRVVDVKETDQGVEVTTKNGKTFKGDIVIGADGVHSAVRRLLQGIADKIQPGYIPERDKTGMFSEYSCIFGVSTATGDLKAGSADTIYNDKFSFLTATGVSARLYWFLFVKMDKKYCAPNIPRFTEADCEQMAQKYFKSKITETTTFEDCWNNRIAATLTALEEHVFSRWHFGRMVFMGDAAHKVTPNFGQGENCCIESVALFSNILNRELSKENSGKLSNEKITAVFQEFQEGFKPRAQRLLDTSSFTTRLQARDGLKMKAFIKVLPNMRDKYVTRDLNNLIEDAHKLDYVDTPYQHGAIPWGDSLEATQIKRSRFEILLGSSLFVALAALSYRCMHMATARNGFWELIENAAKARFYENEGIPLRNRFTGFESVDEMLTTLVTAFTPTTEVFDEGYSLFSRQFIVTFLPVVAIWNIESKRWGNFMSATTFQLFFAILYQLYTIGSIAPVFYLLHFLQINGARIHHRPNYRHVPLEYAKTLLPTLILGFLIPTILMYAPKSLISDLRTRQLCTAIWQPFPLYVSFVHRYLTSWCSRDKLKVHQNETALNTTDMKYLRQTYLFAFAVSALTHGWTNFVSVTSADPAMHWRRVWTLASWDIDAPVTSPAEGVQQFLLFDYYISFVAGIVWVLLAVADLKRSGKTQIGWGSVVGAVAGGWVLVGPGAVMVAAWAWREEVLAFGKSRKVSGKVKDL